jgi:hypothetical protein
MEQFQIMSSGWQNPQLDNAVHSRGRNLAQQYKITDGSNNPVSIILDFFIISTF